MAASVSSARTRAGLSLDSRSRRTHSGACRTTALIFKSTSSITNPSDQTQRRRKRRSKSIGASPATALNAVAHTRISVTIEILGASLCARRSYSLAIREWARAAQLSPSMDMNLEMKEKRINNLDHQYATPQIIAQTDAPEKLGPPSDWPFRAYACCCRPTGNKSVALVMYQSAAIPYRSSDAGLEVLLVTSRRRGRWVLPKGRSAQAELDQALQTWQGVFRIEPSVTDPDAGVIVAANVRPRKMR